MAGLHVAASSGLVDLLDLGLALRAADVERLQAGSCCACSAMIVGAPGLAPAACRRRRSSLLPSTASILSDHGSPKAVGDLGVALGLGLLEGLLEAPSAPRRTGCIRRLELLRVDHDAFDAGGHLQRVVLHVLAGPAEDGVQQFLFRASARSCAWARPCRPGCRPAGRRCPTRTMPFSSRLRSAFSVTLGMSRVNSSRPSLVSRISMSNSSMWIEV